jgi:hypothetical protein
VIAGPAETMVAGGQRERLRELVRRLRANVKAGEAAMPERQQFRELVRLLIALGAHERARSLSRGRGNNVSLDALASEAEAALQELEARS